MNLAELFSRYPDAKTVWETSDGANHLSEEDAQAQASHLAETRIVTHKRPKTADADPTPTNDPR